MIERLIFNYNDSLNNDLKESLKGISLKDMVVLYLKYTNPVYIQTKKNISLSLNVIYEEILNKLNSVPLIELIDIYIDIFLEELFIEDSIESYKNIIFVRNCNLKDDFFLNYEAQKRKISKDEFLDMYMNNLSYYNESLEYHNESFKYLDTVQKNILSYIDNEINNLSEDKLSHLLRDINQRIDDNSNEILKRNELRKNKKMVEIKKRISDNPILEIFSMFDISKLKKTVYVYKSYQSSIITKLDTINKK